MKMIILVGVGIGLVGLLAIAASVSYDAIPLPVWCSDPAVAAEWPTVCTK